ncbi:hypothetical protein TEA_029051 [Camellia sinensis var. sinensis]|uniref:Uncharacterized protein n=1 Tax=Camellia sinensis var. sinensis TaxID=542762 RepID=A0A4S4E838_CAMSN|nr:hypothetical protein TEA_029051 [Camellia sinensis var. sinensis]
MMMDHHIHDSESLSLLHYTTNEKDPNQLPEGTMTMDPPPSLTDPSSSSSSSSSSLRWAILRHAFLPRPPSPDPDKQPEIGIKSISRKAIRGFNLIQFHVKEENSDSLSTSRDVCVFYTLPITGSPELCLFQRADNHADLYDFEICNSYNIDNTGLVCFSFVKNKERDTSLVIKGRPNLLVILYCCFASSSGTVCCPSVLVPI